MTEQSFPIQLRDFVEGKQIDIAATLPKQIDPERFIRVALLAVTKNKDIWDCSKESVFLAIMESARVGLQIDNKEAALIPYGGHAEFMPMVQGITRLMLRSPGLTKVEARAVYEGDDFGYIYGLKPKLEHLPANESQEVTHAYAIMWRQGADPTFEVVDREQIEQARETSRAPNSPAWKNWYGEMARKVVLKRLAKYADLSPEATRAIEIDHAVTGDPWGSEYVDGASEDYQSMLVRNQTEVGIERMKERMASDSNETPAFAHKPGVLKAVVEAGSAQDEYHADAILKKLATPLNVSAKKAVEAAQTYRAYRDADNSSDAAAVKTQQDLSDV